MIIEKQVLVHIQTDEVVARITTFMLQAGYKLVSQAHLQFTRGSMFRSLTSLSPLSWQTTTQITLHRVDPWSTQISIRMRVNTMGQWVLAKERAVLEIELESLAQAVTSGTIHIKAIKQADRSARKNSCLAVLVFSAVAVPIGIAVGALEITITGQYQYYLVGIVVGIFTAFLVLQRYFGAG